MFMGNNLPQFCYSKAKKKKNSWTKPLLRWLPGKSPSQNASLLRCPWSPPSSKAVGVIHAEQADCPGQNFPGAKQQFAALRKGRVPARPYVQLPETKLLQTTPRAPATWRALREVMRTHEDALPEGLELGLRDGLVFWHIDGLSQSHFSPYTLKQRMTLQ